MTLSLYAMVPILLRGKPRYFGLIQQIDLLN
jgi:hypothetical protein